MGSLNKHEKKFLQLQLAVSFYLRFLVRPSICVWVARYDFWKALISLDSWAKVIEKSKIKSNALYSATKEERIQ